MRSRVQAFSTTANRIPIDYSGEGGRLKISLPKVGDRWFFINPATTLQDICGQAMEEDPSISKVRFANEKGEDIGLDA